ncbi:lipopolysaccharide assembly protein LapB [Aliiglaciecola sp. 2_MG-2023]|uniref:lipopolysaccharide assembly protein LapB n=1 Tax=Alteromonadaceae TaxID=72275 RepID=UPI0026E25B2F|nr:MULTISPECIES: lipopolysaccharide assembly protein LapB [unclassified Aliiglaciecola]MDO6712727.1 lipopolysaccharide assembly protein LapB [Aliiglaciecola sp. 2_MG-2023]MDO6753874.1 lipopolysaccharide assembly protein LapB [Aliiglaciecola sp. 1_MG-2023]
MLELLFLLLPVAAGYGYVMGRNSVRQAQRKQSSILSRHYFKGLNFLLSDQPDKAVDTLMKMMSLDSDTVETHIAMGNFFRHRGELDRAIRVHQNLVSKQELSESQNRQALRELGKDYMMAGFLERAENAFLELLDSDKHFLDAQQHLFSIYQTTKEWDRAIELGERMMDCHGDSDELCIRISHFYCEQALKMIKQEKYETAEKSLQKAIAAYEHGVRPWLILGDLSIQQGDYQKAFDYLKEVPVRDISWFSEAVPKLEQCAEKLNNDAQLEAVLDLYWQQCATSYLAKVKLLAKKENTETAETVLFDQLKKTPTMKGFKTLMGFFIEDEVDDKTRESLTMVKGLVEEQIKMRPKYRCLSCGFSGRQIHWLCPSCKKWGVVKPIKGLDGE